MKPDDDPVVIGMALTAWIAADRRMDRAAFLALAASCIDSAHRDDDSTPEHPRADGSYGWPSSD